MSQTGSVSASIRTDIIPSVYRLMVSNTDVDCDPDADPDSVSSFAVAD
jgi:hypothetical protein